MAKKLKDAPAQVAQIKKVEKLSFTLGFKMPKVSLEGKTKEYAKKSKIAITKAVNRASGRIETGLKKALDKAMGEVKWAWGTTTYRKSGEVAGSPRDIIDTGELMYSGKVSTKLLQTKVVFTIQYNAPYAALVHYGGMMSTGAKGSRTLVSVKGRPWISGVLKGEHGFEKFDHMAILKETMNEAWTEQFG